MNLPPSFNLPPGTGPGDIPGNEQPSRRARRERPEDFEKACPACGQVLDITAEQCSCGYEFGDKL